MWKFMRGKGHQPTAERARIQKELFQFKKTVHHGFPNRPSALAWDPQLKLMAIGTRTGSIKVYGAPGVEFYSEHDKDCTVMQLFFLPNQGRLVSLCDDNSLHLWEINFTGYESEMVEIKSCSLEGRMKKISTCCLQSNGANLLIGTEGGNIYLLDVKSFEMTDHIIYQDVVMQNVPDDYKVNPGAVEAISEHPSNPDKILIGYNRGLLVLWDNKSLNADQTYVGSQQLESISWNRSGSVFMSAHNDGSYVIWNTGDSTKPDVPATTPYGPFPCKAVNKIEWRTAKRGEFIIFSGGMPRASFGDRNTISVINGDKHSVFELTSRVIDFFTISDADEEYEYDEPHSLVILAEEEMVVIDLESEDWPVFKAPYLTSLHSSAITCAQHCSNVPVAVWDKLIATGDEASKDVSQREWPITGGKVLQEPQGERDLLLTGHEDGTVRFWDASSVALQPLYKLSTSQLFRGEEICEQNSVEEEEWPPFRKVGTFDPFSDDPRLAIKKIMLCAETETLIIAGTAGQVIICKLNAEECEKELEVSALNFVGDRDNFVWKGHDQLSLKTGSLKFCPGFQPETIMQIHPPAACTALALHSDWGLIATGTAHGFGLFDYFQRKTVVAKCTLNPNDISGVGENTMSRRKSFKKSLRESFRRLRKGRSQRHTDKKKTPSPGSARSVSEEKKDSAKESPVDAENPIATAPADSILAAGAPSPNLDAKPVERQIEARSTDDALGSMVRCLYLANTYIASSTAPGPTLWAGTNNGTIFVYTIVVPTNEKRKENQVLLQLGKEIHLKHRAPVIAICVVDGLNRPLIEPLEGKLTKPSENNVVHRVVICSEEQFKVFTLPALKPYGKFKLTAHEGSRVRKIGFMNFRSKRDSSYNENCFSCLTNQGDLSIFSIPDLRRQLVSNCIKREDISGISSLVFTRFGEGFYLHSSSELQRFSLSAQRITYANCKLELPEGMRPVPKEETPVDKIEENNEDDKDTVETQPADNVVDTISAPVDSLGSDEIKEQEVSVDKPETNEIAPTEEEKKDESAGDITIDSIRDHITTTTLEDHQVVITEHHEQKVETRELQESSVTTVIQTTTTLISESNATAEAD